VFIGGPFVLGSGTATEAILATDWWSVNDIDGSMEAARRFRPECLVVRGKAGLLVTLW